MKETLKDISSTIVDVAISVILTILAFHALLCVLAYNLAADEVLTSDERVVALTLLGEARGEGKLGMYAVGCVIQKRAEQRNLSPKGVCLQRKQFSIWNGIKREQELYYLWKSPSTPYARELAREICKGNKLDQKVTGGANHYHSKNLIRAPYWTRDRKPSAEIKNHIFFNLSAKRRLSVLTELQRSKQPFIKPANRACVAYPPMILNPFVAPR
jgi:hypothetical protein